MSGLTLGHFLYAAAAFEVVVVPLMALRMLHTNPDARPATLYLVTGVAIVTAIGLVAVGTFSDAGRMPIF